MLADADAHQVQVISKLIASGDAQIAARITLCMQERQARQGRWPWRCRSAGCWACRRTLMRSWWRGMMAWPEQPWTSLAVIPLAADLISSIRRLRKGLRDIRDRAACLDQQWAGVAMAGLVSERIAMVLIQHSGLDRTAIWWALAARRPETVLVDVADAHPSWRMAADDAAALARCRRGIEPIRIVVMPQSRSFSRAENDAMPIVF